MVDASTQCYYLDAARNQQGPVSAADLARLVRSGAITRDTLIWFAGMPDWRPAGQVNELASLFGPPAGPPPMRPPMAPGAPAAMRGPAMGIAQNTMGQRAMAAQAAAAGPTDGLIPDYPVWGLFWRVLVFGFCAAFIIPAPWCIAALYRYVIGRTSLPDGRRFVFAGSGNEIWYLFIGPILAMIVLSILSAFIPFIGILSLLAELFLVFVVPWLIIRWICEKVGTEDGAMKLAFQGSVWGFVGWYLLLFLSYITIIGWAWVIAAMQRWICRNVSGTHHFDFAGSGLEILWRTLVFVLCSYLIIPIPWMMRWYYSWFVSQIRVADARA